MAANKVENLAAHLDANAADKLDSVRNILFGDSIISIQHAIANIEQRLDALSAELKQQKQQLQAEISSSATELSQSSQQQALQLQAELGDLEAQHSLHISQSNAQLEQQAKQLRAELGELASQTSSASAGLSASKVDRSSLAALFAELAQRMADD